MQTSSYAIKIDALLLLSILLLTLVGYCIQSIAACAQDDFSMYYYNNTYTPVIFENLFNTIKGNVLNFTRPFEHTVVIDASHIFPNETLKHKIIEKSGQLEFNIPILKYNLLGFNISATDIKVKANVKEIGHDNNTRIDFPVMQARDVNVRNGVSNQNFTNVDLSSIYAIYDPKTDKFTLHVPYSIAAKYLFTGQ
ncbi:MAG: hypothetical protein WBZ36_10500 [Candidatus Nitrosopolaris sp.]